MELSVIIPTYNRPDSLAECLQSLQHNDAEFIVVDDGSETPVQTRPNVRLLRHSSNRGRAAAINTGLRAASHDMVLVVDDDIYAAPDLVVRLVDEFKIWNNPRLALVGRVVWDPEIPITLTMRWMEEVGPFREISAERSGPLSTLFTGNTLMWRPFVLEHGGFDEHFVRHTLEDTELGLRLKQHGLEVRLLASAVAYHHKTIRVRDLAERQLNEGFSAVYLHSKFSEYVAAVDDVAELLSNLEREKEVAAATERIAALEQEVASVVPFGASDLFMQVYRYYSLKGILDGLKASGALRRSHSAVATLGLFDAASYLETQGELGEARRLFRLIRERQDQEYWAGAEYFLGKIEFQCGNRERAHGHFTDCLKLDPEHEPAQSALSMF